MSVSVEKVWKARLEKNLNSPGRSREHAKSVSLSTDFLIIVIVKQTNSGFVKSEVKKIIFLKE